MSGADGSARDGDYPMVGETLGLWKLIGGLGRGGMGEVYEAEYDYLHLLSTRYPHEDRDIIRKELAELPRTEQAKLAGEMYGSPLPADARFAIKVCNARSGTPGHRRFLQEAEVAQRLGDHPYIVTVHAIHGGGDGLGQIARRLELDRGKHRDVAFMVMDLAVRTYDHSRLSIGEAVHIVRCIATALDHAHSRGIVHRDLKPENILGSVEHPLLTDFGIAKEIDQTEGLTRTGQIIGTLDYMSPEQATDAKRVDHRSDIYSLGVVLYEFATQGRLPYSHKLDRDSCLTAIRSEQTEPKWPREHTHAFPSGLERIILKAMSHRMEDRYQAMSEFITDLDRYTRGEWITFWGRVKMRAWLRYVVRSHPRTLWSLVAVVVAVVGVTLTISVQQLLDVDRRSYDKDLAQLARDVAELKPSSDGAPSPRQQLDEGGIKKLKDVRARLGLERSYPDLKGRLDKILDNLHAWRRLQARFVPPDNGFSARNELQFAAGITQPPWRLTNDGLVVQDKISVILPEYGRGTVYVLLDAELPRPTATGAGIEPLDPASGFSLTISENTDPRHFTRWTIENGNLVCRLREDDRGPVPLRSRPFDARRRISIATELGPARIRTWIGEPRPETIPVRGLKDGAEATIELNLPKDTVLRRIEIWPQAGPP